MTYLIFLAAFSSFAGAGQPDQQPACGRYFVVHNPPRVRILDELSAPRGLSATGRDLKLESVLENLIGDGSFAIRSAARAQSFVDRVELAAVPCAAGVAVRMRWMAKDLTVRETVISPRDPTLGDVTLHVRLLEDHSYEVTFGPNLRPLYREDTAPPHVAAGQRQVLIWHFGAGGELREIGLRLVMPRAADAPVEQVLLLHALNPPPIR